MAFVKGSQIFTNSGWKKIEDISGKDKVLVRNFIGDAEFIQPFALKKREYSGEIVKIGARRWSFSVTPEHTVVYDRNKYAQGKHFKSSRADEMVVHGDNRIYRKFKYMFSEDQKKESIVIRDDFGKRTVTISDYDWYKLVGYVLCRGFIRMSPGKPMLFLFLDEERIEEEIRILGDILDRIGLSWHTQYSEKTRAKIVVSSRNTLARRLITRLGSKKRKEMFIPDKMIYGSTKELAKLLIETVKEVSASKRERFQLVTTNKAMLDSLTMIGTLSGYSMSTQIIKKAGEESINGVSKKDSYILTIADQTDTYSPRYIKKLPYSGQVYEIDLFDGQVYVKDGATPVWVNPK